MTILVTGGRGQVARALVGQLVAAGHKVRVASRNPAAVHRPAGVPEQVEVVEGDLARPETFPAALAGATRVFLYAEPQGVDGFLEAAKTVGVEHVVLLSAARAAERVAEDPADPIAHLHWAAEQAVAASGIAWTFLQAGGFATNTLQWAEAIRAEGVVRAPYPRAQAAPIHEADLAAVALHTLTEPGHAQRGWVLTGPESLTQQQQVELIGEAIGRPLRFVELSPDAYRQTLRRWGDAALVEALLRHLAQADGHPATVTNTVQQITGRPARTFAQWATDHAADFR